MPIYWMHLYLTCWDRRELKLRTNWWFYLIQDVKIVQILAEVQKHMLFLIYMDKLVIANMFSQYGSYSEYNAACNSGIGSSTFQDVKSLNVEKGTPLLSTLCPEPRGYIYHHLKCPSGPSFPPSACTKVSDIPWGVLPSWVPPYPLCFFFFLSACCSDA